MDKIAFVDFCLSKVRECQQKCEAIEKKNKLWFMNKEWIVQWNRWGYYMEKANREVRTWC